MHNQICSSALLMIEICDPNAQSSIRRGITYLKAHLKNTKVPQVPPDQVPWVPSGLLSSYTAVSTSAQSLLSFCYHKQQHYSTTIDAIDNKYWRSLEKVKFQHFDFRKRRNFHLRNLFAEYKKKFDVLQLDLIFWFWRTSWFLWPVNT